MMTRSSKDQFDANADKYAVSDVHRTGERCVCRERPGLSQVGALAHSDVGLEHVVVRVVGGQAGRAAELTPDVGHIDGRSGGEP